ncbi:MAG: class I SAM-dependent methyltransferase [Candidatus Hydrogenedentota bacterium]
MTTENRFNKAAATWDENPRRMALTEAIANGIQESIPLSDGMTMLEFGCGTASLSILLAQHVGHISAADTSSGMIAEARRKVAASPELAAVVEPILLTDGDALPQGKWDVVCTAMTLHHIEDAAQMLRQLAWCLNPGGYLAVADLFPEDGSFHGQERVPHNGFDPQALAAVLKEEAFEDINTGTVLTFSKRTDDNHVREFSVFLVTGRRDARNSVI